MIGIALPAQALGVHADGPRERRWRARRTSSGRAASSQDSADDLALAEGLEHDRRRWPGAAISSATRPCRIRKNSSAGSPSRNRYSPACEADVARAAGKQLDLRRLESRQRTDAPDNMRSSPSIMRSSLRLGLPVMARSLFGDVDADGAPGDAAAAADAAGACRIDRSRWRACGSSIAGSATAR